MPPTVKRKKRTYVRKEKTVEEQIPVVEPTKQAETAPEPVAKPAVKPKRVPVGLRNPMAVHTELDPNFHYHVVRGKRGRVEQFLAGGYEMAPGDTVIGDPNIATASNMGSTVTLPSGDNEDKCYLMRIPIEFYNEDQAAKAAKVDEIEAHLKRQPKDAGLEGQIKGI